MRSAAASAGPAPLERLIGGIDVLQARGDFSAATITNVTHRHDDVRPGALFCCLRGRRRDGHDFAGAAVASGAVALLCERPLEIDAPQAIVADSRAAMAPLAAEFFGHPSRRLSVMGVTGTNGKTTVTHFLQSVLAADGRAAAVIGTLTGRYTTPEAPELQGQLAGLADAGINAVAMEVSSHALVEHRVDAVWFEVVAFTNLSQDHLDYHGDMESYFAAKASLFDPARARVGVVNVGDPWGRRLAESTTLPVRPFSLADAAGLTFEGAHARFSWDGAPVQLRMGGTFNVVNALTAAAAARELGVPADAVAEGLGAVAAVPGRFERVDAGGPVAVIVDYAHTPTGLEEVLPAARRLAAPDGGRLIVVFGAGGDRDHGKRSLMGAAATRLADVAVLTSDNPRSEDPAAIIADVLAGAGAGATASLVVEPDRRAAIALALEEARPGDVVVIAGKGHETTQTFAGGRAVPFDDRVVAREELARR